MEFRAKQIAPPKEWAVFEDLCLAIFRAEWNDALALKNGRSGQPQHGVDVYGSPHPERALIYGVQCKGKDRNYGSKASASELRSELAKAEHFSPVLVHWIFATSASKDGTLQQTARELAVAREAQGQFPVTALGWEDIQSLLARHPDVIKDFYPEHAYDIGGLLTALRGLPSSAEIRELRDQIRRLTPTRSAAHGRPEDARWDLVSFDDSRDLGPALLGRGLGPSDAGACPRLEEADMIAAQLRRAFSARLVGEPGSGKSVCAYQSAGDFSATGWTVRRIRDASALDELTSLPTDDLCLLMLDDAHLMQSSTLQQIEDTAGARRLVLSIHNGVEQGISNRGAVFLDAKRAVRTIAAELLENTEGTLAAVMRADDDVGVTSFKEPLEQRIQQAAIHSDRPWQFCFVLGGGWKRAKESADSARVAGADLVLAAAGIVQIASRDAPLVAANLRRFCEMNGLLPDDTLRAISWLISQRLLISDTDCRCPHQRFALVALGKILEGQNEQGRATISDMLSAVVGDVSYPIAGQRILLHELRFLGDYRRWTWLVQNDALERLIARCWSVTTADDRLFAALIFSDLDAYISDWLLRINKNYQSTIAEWVEDALPPTAYGLYLLLNSIRNENQQTGTEIIEAVDPRAIADALSRVTPETAGHCANLIKTIGWTRPETWKAAFDKTFNKAAAITLARTWPSSEPLYDFSELCAALSRWDDELGLALVKEFIPTAQKAFADNPVSAFRMLEDILDHVLRLSDPLGVYVGGLAPNRRRFAIGKAICAALKPKLLATQLSATPQRDFQSATFFLGFLRKAFNSKFKATVEAIDWANIASVIGENWANLPHEAEILLTVSYSSPPARALISEAVAQHLDRIESFSPRLAIMVPGVAVRHIESGKQIRLGQHGHFEFEFSALFIAQLSQTNPDLIERVILPFEQVAGAALSQQNSSWFIRAPLFVEVLREAAPVSLQRILSAVDPSKAEAGWADSLHKPGSARDAVALLIDSALGREDTIGDLARRLRKKFRGRSVPKIRKYRRRRGTR